VHLQRKYAPLGVELNQVSIWRNASDLAGWTCCRDFAYLNDGPLAPQPAQPDALCRTEAQLVNLDKLEYLLLRVECLELLVEIVTAVFCVSDPYLGLLIGHWGSGDMVA